MKTLTGPPRSELQPDGLHVVFGSGGSKAILGGAGAILAFEVAGLRDWVSIGSASGGSLPAAFLASGKPTKEILRVVVDTDFSKLLKPRTGIFRRLLALLMKYRNEITRPERGVYSSGPLSAFVENYVGDWPARFWTVGSGRAGLYIFTEHGVIRERKDEAQLIMDTPACAALAVAATCAVPGFIDAVRFRGDILHDGALGPDGECPAGVSVRHFGAARDKVIAFDIAEEAIKSKRWLRLLWNLGCGGRCPSFEGAHLTARDGYVLISPHITGFHGLQFDLAKEQKWQAIAIGFRESATTLLAHGLVPAANQARLKVLCDGIEAARKTLTTTAFTGEVERILIRSDLLA